MGKRLYVQRNGNQLSKYQLGLLSENIAVDFLLQYGYVLVRKRFKCQHGEIDIICQKEDNIIFVEVKKRKTSDDALFSISSYQKQRIVNAAKKFLSNINWQKNVRFDVIAFSNNMKPIHIENAWQDEE